MFHIRVIDQSSSDPVPDVIVRLLDPENLAEVAHQATTGENGVAYLSAEVGDWWLFLAKRGYAFPSDYTIQVEEGMSPDEGWTVEGEDLNRAPTPPSDARLCVLYGQVYDGGTLEVPSYGMSVQPIWPKKFRRGVLVSGAMLSADRNGRVSHQVIRDGVYSFMVDGEARRVHIPDAGAAELSEVLYPEPQTVFWSSSGPDVAELDLAAGAAHVLTPRLNLSSGDTVPFTWGDTREVEGLDRWVRAVVISGSDLIDVSLGKTSLEIVARAAGIAIVRMVPVSENPLSVPEAYGTYLDAEQLVITVSP